MAIKITGRNRLELLLIFFWTLGWPMILFYMGSQLDMYLSEAVITVLIIVLYVSAFPLHFFIMDFYYSRKFNKMHTVNCSVTEYRYIKKHLHLIPTDESLQNYSMEIKKSIYIYMAYQKDIKKSDKPFVTDAIKTLRDNQLM